MMRFFNLPISDARYWYVKDLFTLIYNKERKRYPKLYNHEYIALLEKRIQKRYHDAKGSKSVDEILKEYWKEIRKKEDK